jgi:hypothetical protein
MCHTTLASACRPYIGYLIAAIVGEQLEPQPGRLELPSIAASMISIEMSCLRRRNGPHVLLEISRPAPTERPRTYDPRNTTLDTDSPLPRVHGRALDPQRLGIRMFR